MAQLLTSANAKLHNDAQHLLPGWQKNLTIFIKKAWAPRHHEINHNRRGEMFCGTLLWNRMLEDAGIGGFLSLGWNLGFAREFSGSLLSPPANAYNRASGRARETRKTIREAQIKTSLVVAYTGSPMLLTGLII